MDAPSALHRRGDGLMISRTRNVTPQDGAGTEVSKVNAERRHQVAIIKGAAKTVNNGRSYLLMGLWACRLAAGLTQRQLAEVMGSTQATVGQLERQQRGAYPKTIVRLCDALRVAPEDLLSSHSPERGEPRSLLHDDSNGGGVEE
jgi:DNA-binding Xre family transcriptional regulator